MLFRPALLVAPFLLALQESPPGEVYKKLEQSLKDAKSVIIRFKAEGQVTENGLALEKLERSGELLVKDGGKVRLTIRKLKPVSEEYMLTVKGQESIAKVKKDGSETLHLGTAPAEFDQWWRVAFLRLGFGLAELQMLHLYFGEDGRDPRTAVKITKVSAEDVTKDVKTISFQLEDAVHGQIGQVTLSLDSKTRKLLRRKATYETKARQAEFIETYETYAIDEHIPDESFK